MSFISSSRIPPPGGPPVRPVPPHCTGVASFPVTGPTYRPLEWSIASPEPSPGPHHLRPPPPSTFSVVPSAAPPPHSWPLPLRLSQLFLVHDTTMPRRGRLGLRFQEGTAAAGNRGLPGPAGLPDWSLHPGSFSADPPVLREPWRSGHLPMLLPSGAAGLCPQAVNTSILARKASPVLPTRGLELPPGAVTGNAGYYIGRPASRHTVL
jgi:hypothetical protein